MTYNSFLKRNFSQSQKTKYGYAFTVQNHLRKFAESSVFSLHIVYIYNPELKTLGIPIYVWLTVFQYFKGTSAYQVGK